MSFATRLLVVTSAGLLVGCGARGRVVPPPPAPPAVAVAPFTGPVAPEVPLVADPIAEFIARVEKEFAAGREEWDRDRLVAAREHFDRAVDLLLSVKGGARTDPRLNAELEHLLDRISALDVMSLREGDGFTESKSEPAAIDELLNAATFEPPTPLATTEETVAQDLERLPRDVPIPVNQKVLSYVELFQGRLHDFFQAGLDRGQRYLPMIQNVFRSQGIPVDLSYVPLVESAFKLNALSRVSAKGMWQFMQATGNEYGLKTNWFIDERSDPEKATLAAAQYLKALNDMFDGDWHFALASYNAGQGRLLRAARQSKKSDYWEITATSRYLPRETREYVPMILAAIIIGKNPTLYGFDVTAPPPLAFETVTVPNALDLKFIAEWADVPIEQIQELNPELRRTTTPMGGHSLKVPMGTAAPIREQLASAEPLYRTFKFHEVKSRESLTSVARKYGVSVAELRTANELSSKARIRRGQVLSIPQRTATAIPSGRAARPAVNANAQTSVTYRVRQGDTLSSIARQFATTVDSLKRLNRLSSDRISIGLRLTVRR
ncbi:MAG TPA: LysM peptidoglycan-binding domain-containing protein [Vicinamibacterales bacterium]|jgi:membrane-bound lytic murein transglycosylase D